MALRSASEAACWIRNVPPEALAKGTGLPPGYDPKHDACLEGCLPGADGGSSVHLAVPSWISPDRTEEMLS
jgi:hypothetical protein